MFQPTPPGPRSRPPSMVVIAAVIALVVAAIGVIGYFAQRPSTHGRAVAASTSNSTTASASTSTSTSTSTAPRHVNLSGHWTGTYTCNQGLTGLDLDITQRSATTIEAVFSFYAHPTNLAVPSGSFSMVGTFDEASSALALNATEWINQPPGYGTVGLRGIVSNDQLTISGQVVQSAGCTSFTVQRKAVDQ